jgi:carboxymethylenebutenolidase
VTGLKELNTFQRYFVEEFYDDYVEGLITRRQFIRRVAFITGSIAATIATMSILGCSESELPTPTAPMPTPTARPLAPVPGAQSPHSVPEGDPAVITSEVAFAGQGAQIRAYQARPAAAGTYAGVLVCHENRGLTPHIADVARRFARAGYVALAVDLLSRNGGTAAVDQDQAPGLLSGAPPEQHVADFAAGLRYLQTLDYVDAQRIGMTGYCFGGGIAWRCAVALPELKAAVPFYGPAPDLAQVPNIKAAVFGVYAEQDTRINASIEPLSQALTDAGVTHQMKVYPGVNHAFHNDTGPRYVEAQATQAWQDTLSWFRQHL